MLISWEMIKLKVYRVKCADFIKNDINVFGKMSKTYQVEKNFGLLILVKCAKKYIITC